MRTIARITARGRKRRFASRTILLGSLIAPAVSFAAEPHRTGPDHDVMSYPIVYTRAGMDRVSVRKDVAYKTIDGRALGMDVYAPAGLKPGELRPAVVFVNGVGDRPGMSVKDWGQYTSWPRLVAASGSIGVSMSARGGDDNAVDLRDAFRYLHEKGATLGIDPKRVAAWSCSANVSAALAYLMTPDADVKAAVAYYGASDVTTFRNDLPVLFVRAGRDNPQFMGMMDQLIGRALAANAPWTVKNLPASHHAFDILDDTEESRAAILMTLAFLDEHLGGEKSGPRGSGGGSTVMERGDEARKAAGASPGHPSPEARAAAAHMFAREWAEAERAYSDYIKTHPGDADAYVFLGNSQLELKHYDDARASLTRAKELDPGIGEVYGMLGKVAVEQKRPAEAMPFLQRAVEVMPDDSEARYQLGRIYVGQKRYDEAVTMLEESVRLNPGNGYAWNNLALASLALKRYPRAIESLQRVLSFVPADPGVNYNLACAYALSGDTTQAFASLDKAIASGYKDRANLAADPDLASLRGNPRFQETLAKLP